MATFEEFYKSLDPDSGVRGKQFEKFVKWFLRLILFINLRSKKCFYGTNILNDLNGDPIVELICSSMINLEKLGQYKRSVLPLIEASKSQILIVFL